MLIEKLLHDALQNEIQKNRNFASLQMEQAKLIEFLQEKLKSYKRKLNEKSTQSAVNSFSMSRNFTEEDFGMLLEDLDVNKTTNEVLQRDIVEVSSKLLVRENEIMQLSAEKESLTRNVKIQAALLDSYVNKIKIKSFEIAISKVKRRFLKIAFATWKKLSSLLFNFTIFLIFLGSQSARNDFQPILRNYFCLVFL